MPVTQSKELTNREVHDVSDRCLEIVASNFAAAEHLPQELQSLLQPIEVATCQGAFPVLVMTVGSFAGLTNGAQVQMWSAAPTPISVGALYVGDAQQGKSRLSTLASGTITAADEIVASLAQSLLDNADAPDGDRKPSRVTVRFIGMMDFTPLELFVRCSGDWPQVKEAPDLDLPGLENRLWYSMLVNLDESYSFLQSMGMISSDTSKARGKDSNPSVHASTLNTLIGTGKTQRDTRTSGSYGGSKALPLNVAILGNLHWRMLIAMERGAIGNHVAATKERFLVCAGQACRRHSDLPADFKMPETHTSLDMVASPRPLSPCYGMGNVLPSPAQGAGNAQRMSSSRKCRSCTGRSPI